MTDRVTMQELANRGLDSHVEYATQYQTEDGKWEFSHAEDDRRWDKSWSKQAVRFACDHYNGDDDVQVRIVGRMVFDLGEIDPNIQYRTVAE